MIVQTGGINARINRLAHSFCSKPLAKINGIFHRERCGANGGAGERQSPSARRGERGRGGGGERERLGGEIEKIKHCD